MRPCPRREVRPSPEALGLSETTASVLVRRGYGDPDDGAGPSSRPRIPAHDPFLLGDVEAACALLRETIAPEADLRPRRLRRRRDLRHGARGQRCCAAWAPRSTGTCPAGSRRATASRRDARAPRRGRLQRRADGRLRNHRGRRGRRRRELGLEVVVTDHHRPGDSLPDCPVVATRPSDYPFPELCGTGVVFKLAQARRARGRSTATSTSLRSPPSRTSSRSWTRTAGSSRRAYAGSRTTKPGLRALMRSRAGRPGHRRPPARSASGSRRGSTPPGGSATRRGARPSPDRRPRGGRPAGGRARDGSTATARRSRTASSARPSPGGRVARASSAAAGYVLAGEDWHRGVIGIVASRLVERFHRPVVLIAGGEDGRAGRARAGRSRRSTCTAGSAPAPAPARGGAGTERRPGLSIRPENVEAFAEAFAAHAAGVLAEADLGPRCASTRSWTGRADARSSARSSSGWRRSGSATRAMPARGGLRALGARRGGRGQAPEARGDRERRPLGGRSPSGRGRARPLPRAGLYDVAFQAGGEPLERDGRAAARRPADLRDRPRATKSFAARARGGVEGRPGGLEPAGAAIFDELGLEQPSGLAAARRVADLPPRSRGEPPAARRLGPRGRWPARPGATRRSGCGGSGAHRIRRAASRALRRAAGRGRGVQPGGRSRPARARVPLRLRGARAPAAAQRGGLHPPPARRREDPRRAATDDATHRRGAPPRRRRGHRHVDRGRPRGVRRRGRPPRRGRDEADPDPLPEPRAGRRPRTTAR